MKLHHILLATATLFALVACSFQNTTPSGAAVGVTSSVGQSTATAAPAQAAAVAAPTPSFWGNVKAWFVKAEATPQVAAVKAEAASLLKTFIFTTGEKKLAGANWADSAAAAIYADQQSLANDPTQLNNLLGTFLPANSQWQSVIDGMVSKLVTGGLNTAPQRLAAIQGIAATLNAQAAVARTQ